MSGHKERQPSALPGVNGSAGERGPVGKHGSAAANKPAGGQGPMGRRGPMRGHGPMGMGRPVEKAKDFKGTLKRLINYLKPHRIRLLVVLIFAAASTIFSIAAPKIMSRAMNSLQESYMAGTMLRELSKAQRTAVDEINKALAAVMEQGGKMADSPVQDGKEPGIPSPADTAQNAWWLDPCQLSIWSTSGNLCSYPCWTP